MKARKKSILAATLLGACALWTLPSEAFAIVNMVQVSLGVRETGTTADIGDDGGTANGIEWVDLDLNGVALDGTWQQLTFNLANPTSVTPFAGGSADGVLSSATGKGTIEHLRIKNNVGISDPIRLWVDHLVAVEATGAPHDLGWEGLTVGNEYIFQEPGFSGSTSGNLVDDGSSQVTDTMAHAGVQSYQIDLQFIDNDITRWARVTTFSGAIIDGGSPTIDLNGEVSFWIKGVVVPEPASLGLMSLGGVVLLRRRAR